MILDKYDVQSDIYSTKTKEIKTMNNIKEKNGIKFFKEITMEELEEKGFLTSNRNYKLEK